MSRAARSIVAFGIYLLVVALLFLTVPNIPLRFLGIAPTTEPWIRVLAIVVAVLGTYYVAAGRAELTPFFRATVWVRLLVPLAFVGLAVLSLAPWILLIFGVVDGIGGLWTWTALRSGQRDT